VVGADFEHRTRLDCDRIYCSALLFYKLPCAIASLRESPTNVVPEAFWYFSLTGGLMPVFILGQVAALAIYSRNIYFIWVGKLASELAKELEISG
jgi:lipid-A-disaccharide synthase-like uncharacterized protein